MVARTAPIEDQIAMDFEDLLNTVMGLVHSSYETRIKSERKLTDIIIWNDQVMTVKFADYNKKDPSIIKGEGPERVIPVKKIEEALCDLLDNGVPFKTDSGTGDKVMCLEFEIND